jgi:uracil-DNA glycosylase
VLRTSQFKFAHAAAYPMPNGVVLLASYHPSNQNTATGKLTASMFELVFREARKIAEAATISPG